MELALDPRQEMILAAVVEAYVEQARPVSSHTIVKRGIKFSPATVRSEMSELENQGLLEQPHTSAGRRPSDRGFRYYVERLAAAKPMRPEDRARLTPPPAREGISSDDIIAGIAAQLSSLSRQVGMALVMPVERTALKSIHFLEQGRERLRVVHHHTPGATEQPSFKNHRRHPATPRPTNTTLHN
jgi:heat-inducible transcriptional repressor